MYRILARIYPLTIRKKVHELAYFTDLKVSPDKLLGFFLFMSVGLSFSTALILARLVKVNFLLLFIISLFFYNVLFYLGMILKADKKGREVEKILPEALQLMASNLRAGLTTDKALLLAARPEFGSFKDEINMVGKEITMGKSISEALYSMTQRIKSDKLKKTILLIISGMESGGELASLLDQTARNLNQQRFVEQRIRSNVMMYFVFIFTAIGIGAPVLFGLSTFLVEVLTTTLSQIEIPTTAVAQSMPLTFSKVSISVDFIVKFAILSMVTTAILGSLILGEIGKGSAKRGIRYIPILILIALTIYFLTRYIIGNSLRGLFNI